MQSIDSSDPLWLVLAVGCMLIGGLQGFLRRRFARWGASNIESVEPFAAANALSAATVTLLLSAALAADADLSSISPDTLWLVILSVVFGACAVQIGRLSGVWVASYVPLGISEPLVRTGIPVLVFLISVIFLPGEFERFERDEAIEFTFGLLFLLAVSVTLVCWSPGDKAGRPLSATGGMLLMVLICGGAAGPFLQKSIVSLGVQPPVYVAMISLILLVWGVYRVLPCLGLKGKKRIAMKRGALSGIVDGALACAGMLLFMFAIKSGPLPVVVAILSGSVAVTILLQGIFSRERINPVRWVGIGVATFAIVATAVV